MSAFGTDLDSVYASQDIMLDSAPTYEPELPPATAVEKPKAPKQVQIAESHMVYEQIANQNKIDQLQKQLVAQQKQITELSAVAASAPAGGAGAYNPGVSVIEQFMSRKREVMRIITYALIIVLGLAINNLLEFSIRQYVLQYDAPLNKEFAMRALYPALCLLVLWTIKVRTRRAD